MMNLVVILALSVLLPSTVLCGTIITSGNNPRISPSPTPSHSLPLRRPVLSRFSKKLNSSQGDFTNVIVKREIPVESTDMFYPDYRITAVSERNFI